MHQLAQDGLRLGRRGELNGLNNVVVLPQHAQALARGRVPEANGLRRQSSSAHVSALHLQCWAAHGDARCTWSTEQLASVDASGLMRTDRTHASWPL
jgi:hypothetical protein